jgi:hypothetical protein
MLDPFPAVRKNTVTLVSLAPRESNLPRARATTAPYQMTQLLEHVLLSFDRIARHRSRARRWAGERFKRITPITRGSSVLPFDRAIP